MSETDFLHDLLKQAAINQWEVVNFDDRNLGDHVAIYRELFELLHIQKLKLRSNSLLFVPASLAQLTNLKTLDLSNNLIWYLPELDTLENLTSINCAYNAIVQIPQRYPATTPQDVREVFFPSQSAAD
eukprot:TRINITY_DN5730_c0_g1_i2.p1 TRINITY_DN5730_c0_g1~~TRINITY_DN5730_c0_g1_i2.p1  ORF type:complete len:144 (-),score=18.69 TRINITY_DN5730_c0_g1_i2:57-440(-)